MFDELPATQPILPEPTEARFSMRALFITMTVLAITAAVVSPLVRRLPPDAQIRLLAAWGIWLLAVIVFTAFQARQRYRAERLAGRTLLRMKLLEERGANNKRSRGSRSVFWMTVGVLIMLFNVSNAAISSRGGLVEAAMFFGVFGVLSIWWSTRVVMLLWWRNTIRFCEAGLLWDRRVMLWEYVLDQRWDESDEKVLIVQGIDQRNLDAVLKISVPADERAAVTSLLDSKVSKSTSVPQGPMIRELGSIPLSIAVRDPNFFKYVGMIVLFICAYIGAMMLFTTGFGGAPREFRDAILLVLIGIGVLSTLRWRFAGHQAGVPLVRLDIRLDWQRVLVFAAAAVACLYVGSNWGWSSVWLAYAAGVGFGWAIGGLIALFIQGRLDFRANGVVLPGIFYWPWPEVRFIQWEREPKGRLILSHGWRRVTAKVPPEQREAVDAVLREKVPQ
jgi:hypothetical protein